MRKMLLGAAALVIVSAGSAGLARGQFVAVPDGGAVLEGEGGVSIARDGVDFWTSGTPARRFQILGTLTDSRTGALSSGQAVGSPSLARQARALGADGLILFDRQVRDGGHVGVWSGGDSLFPLSGSRASSTTTTFVAVRYID
ncbi:MAG: hypothetical protein KF780_09660 [Sphingomonas sp.]|nr:hypothetical protein [Sphingomonas sp.]